MSIRIQVLEYSRAPVVDGVIEGVKIIGTRSRNGYRYPQEVLDKHRELYEGSQVYMLHPTDREKRKGSRQLDDHFGTLMNIRGGRDGTIGTGLFGDLHVKQTHPLAQFVMESDGTKFGLSHNAEVEMNDDQTEVTRIISINSVDLVDHPATNKNLYEETDDMELKELKSDLDAMRQALDKHIEIVAEHYRVTEEKKPEKKPPRITALERVTESAEGEEPQPIGNTHEDFMGALRGFPVTNTKG